MRTTIYIRRDSRHIKTEYATNFNEAMQVLEKYKNKYIDDEIVVGSYSAPYWTIEFVSQTPFDTINIVEF